MMIGDHGHSGNNQDFELNLASIIDCFTVLIAFMLASASFLSIGILDAGVAAAGTTAKTDPSQAPPVLVTLELKKDKTLVLQVSSTQSGKAASVHRIGPSATKGWDHDALTRQLSAVKAKWPTVNAATLMAESEVEYQDLVKTMEVTRRTLPAVLLGGF